MAFVRLSTADGYVDLHVGVSGWVPRPLGALATTCRRHNCTVKCCLSAMLRTLMVAVCVWSAVCIKALEKKLPFRKAMDSRKRDPAGIPPQALWTRCAHCEELKVPPNRGWMHWVFLGKRPKEEQQFIWEDACGKGNGFWIGRNWWGSAGFFTPLCSGCFAKMHYHLGSINTEERGMHQGLLVDLLRDQMKTKLEKINERDLHDRLVQDMASRTAAASVSDTDEQARCRRRLDGPSSPAAAMEGDETKVPITFMLKRDLHGELGYMLKGLDPASPLAADAKRQCDEMLEQAKAAEREGRLKEHLAEYDLAIDDEEHAAAS